MTYREIAYFILDSVKLHSDDSSITLEHIIFLLDKYRLFLIEEKYAKSKEAIASGNTQTICLELEPYSEGLCGSDLYLRSKKRIPDFMDISLPTVFLTSSFTGNPVYVAPERFKYAGSNRYMKNVIFCTINSDNYLYIKSANPQFKYLKQIKVNAVFEDPMELTGLLCDSEDTVCVDPMDTTFCIEQALVPKLIELVQKEILGTVYHPSEHLNDAMDNIADIATYVRQNVKTPLAKAMTE